jgi:hypothetical protein
VGEPTTAAEELVSGAAWRAFCARLAAAGDRILADDFPAAEADRAEGFRHLANQVACWLTYAIGHTDPAHPAFFRSSDLIYLWGGPNADQVARRAMISGDGTYRVSGNMGSCEDFVLQLKLGRTQSGGADVSTELYASGLGLHPGDDFEILLSQTPQPGQWMALHPDTAFVHVRDFYFDWPARQPATFVIERLDTQGTPADPASPDRVAQMLDEAAHEVEHSIVFWKDYQERLRAAQTINGFGPPGYVPRGVQDIVYSHAFVSLADHEALVVELRAADADLWDIQLYNRAWYEALDYATRVTSLNHRQARVDEDGQARIVICGTDPGVGNWLDSAGRAEVMATTRWWRPPVMPELRTEVVPLARLADVLPAATPAVDATGREEQIRRRAAHTAWRYRT